jgi:alpha-glucuronidase
VTVIAATTDIGVLYGAFHFLRLVQTHRSLEHLDLISAPRIRNRVLDHWDNLDRTVERGYAGESIWDWHKLLKSADPLDPAVRAWWRAKADEIYTLIPDFGGFLVKANSEGQPGPQDYSRTHADGANMLAEAVVPHGGIIMWRAFVYSQNQPDDRAKQAYAEFVPLDGNQVRAIRVTIALPTVVDPGAFEIMVGPNSVDLKSVTLDVTSCGSAWTC